MSVIQIGVPKETLPGEKRVAATPESIKKIKERGLGVKVERGAGLQAGISDEQYVAAGAELTDAPFDADVVFKVRPPSVEECAKLKEGALLVSIIQADRNPGLLDALKAKRASVLALEKVPRITRAQKMDVLSSMANLSGYRAVVEAAAHFQGFFSPQITAAGATPPDTTTPPSRGRETAPCPEPTCLGVHQGVGVSGGATRRHKPLDHRRTQGRAKPERGDG